MKKQKNYEITLILWIVKCQNQKQKPIEHNPKPHILSNQELPQQHNSLNSQWNILILSWFGIYHKFEICTWPTENLNTCLQNFYHSFIVIKRSYIFFYLFRVFIGCRAVLRGFCVLIAETSLSSLFHRTSSWEKLQGNQKCDIQERKRYFC